MAIPVLALASGLLLIVAGILCWAVGVHRRAPRTAGALLVLWGAVGLTGALFAAASDLASASLFARLGIWYSLPVPALMVLLLRHVIGEERPSLIDDVVGVVLGVAALILAGMFAFAPSMVISGIAPNVDGQWRITSGPLLYVFGVLAAAAEAYVIVRVGWLLRTGAARSAPGLLAMALAAAVALPLVYNGAFFASLTLSGSWPPASWHQLERALGTILPLVIAAPAILRIAEERSRRRAFLGGLALLTLLGLVDGFVGAGRIRAISFGGYETSFALVRLSFATALSFGIVRFGLADVTHAERPRVRAALRAAAAVVVAIASFTIAMVALGTTAISLLVAVLVGVTVPAVTLGSTARLADRILLPPDDPRAVAERARTYAAAVAAAQGAGAEGELLLAQMRDDLGISLQEHELLVHGVVSRDEDRYRKVETLGHGSTAQVELAMDEIAGKRVVVKRFTGLRDPGAVLKEARTLAAVRHPRVIPFLEVDKRGDDVYLVLAYAEGGNARQLLDREGPLPPARAIGLTCDLLEGLEALHAAGIVHCDVKPENLLLDAEGRGILGDFGSARFRAPDLADATLAGGAAEGSLSTIAPEALRGATPAPERDVYAAGAVLYRLLTGDHYVDLKDATVFEAHERIRLDEPRLSHPRVPAPLIPALRKALAKRPVERYHSAREMRDALDPLRAGGRARP